MYPVAVLAGGLGLRLRELTGDAAARRRWCRCSGARSSTGSWRRSRRRASPTSCCSWVTRATSIRDHVGTAIEFGLAVTYVDDGPTLRGTGGAILHALPAAPRELLGDLRRHVARRRPRRRGSGLRRARGTSRAHDRAPQSRRVGNRATRSSTTAWSSTTGRAPSRRRRAHRLRHAPLPAERVGLPGTPTRSSTWLTCLRPLIAQHEVVAFDVTSRFHDIGTPEAVRETETFLLAHSPSWLRRSRDPDAERFGTESGRAELDDPTDGVGQRG